MLKYKCGVCGEEFKSSMFLGQHMKKTHGINSKEYYDSKKDESEGKCVICGKPTAFLNSVRGYRDCCSRSCSNVLRSRNVGSFKETCRICGEEIEKPNRNILYSTLVKHVKREHGLAQKDYYDKYIKTENEGTCALCSKPTVFRSVGIGYNKFCSVSCSTNNSIKTNPACSARIYAEDVNNKNFIRKIVESIKDKYRRFISGGDKKIVFSDIREDVTACTNESTVESINDPEDSTKQIVVKTEISSQAVNAEHIQEYKPVLESCSQSYCNRYDFIDDDDNFSSNEWCS